jgi:hypothetical protein
MPSSASLSVFTNSYLAPKRVSFGRLVLNPGDPGEDFCLLPSSKVLGEDDVTVAPFDKVRLREHTNRGSRFSAALTDLLSFSHLRSSRPSEIVHADRILTYELLNSGTLFTDTLCTDEASQRWMEKYLKSTTIYMVTGILTIYGAEVTRTDKGSAQTAGGLDVPLSKLIPAAQAFPGSNILDLKFKGKTRDSQKSLVKFVAPDERILAVQYRRISFKAFVSKTIGEAQLQRGKWKVLGAEGYRDSSGNIKDVIDATLEGVGLDDVKRDLECEDDDIWEIVAENGSEAGIFAFAEVEDGTNE